MEVGLARRTRRRNRRRGPPKGIELPFFRVVISVTENHHNLCWLKLDPPEDWLKLDPPEDDHKLLWKGNNDCCLSLQHSHDKESRYFSVKKVDVRSIGKCKYPITCSSESIGSTIYCVGGDKDIDGNIRSIYNERIGPPITKRGINSIPLPPRKNNLSHKIGSCDFFNCPLPPQDEDWKLDNAPPLVSPRFSPYIAAVGHKLFLFGGNLPPVNEDDYVPFAEVFDPAKGECFPICDPPFTNRIGSDCLLVTPLLGKHGEQKILVMSQIITFKEPRPPGVDAVALYDVLTDTWEPFDDPDRNLFHKGFDIMGDPVPVAEQDSIYWLKRSTFPKKTLLICSYNWKTKDFWQGPFIGLDREMTFLQSKHYPKTLLHIHQDLFCFVWFDILLPSSTNDNQLCTHIHFTLLKVSREDPPSPSLSAFVVGCSSHLVPAACHVLSSYVLR